MLILREKDKTTLCSIFEGVKTPIEVWAYGSRVNGTAHSGSDLDLVIRTENLSPLPLEEFQTLCNEIKDSNIPILVEVRDWALIPISFKQNIEENHEIIYTSLIPVLSEKSTKYEIQKKKS